MTKVPDKMDAFCDPKAIGLHGRMRNEWVRKTAAVKGVVVVVETYLDIRSVTVIRHGNFMMTRQYQIQNKLCLVSEFMDVLQNEASNDLERGHFMFMIF